MTDSCLTDRHLMAFARIVRAFAHYERLIDDALVALATADAACIGLLTRGYDFRARRATLLDMLRQVGYPMDRYDRISGQLMLPYTYSMLHYDIIHSVWVKHVPTNGIRPAWIFSLAPTVAPLRDWCDAGVEDGLARSPDEFVYSLDRLEDVADRLGEGHRDFGAYLHEIGLLPMAS
ncbi:hypothetical protein [Pandoraea soli]